MKILQLFVSELGKNPRPTRFYKELSKWGDVTVASKLLPVPTFTQQVDFIKLTAPTWNYTTNLNNFEERIWSMARRQDLRLFQKHPYSLILCQEIELLPFAVAIKNLPQNKGKCKLIMDAREFYSRQLEYDILWRIQLQPLLDYVCKKYLPQADVVFTVSPGLAMGYKKYYDVECALLPSLSYYHNITPHPTNDCLRFIHHGNALSRRRLELMVEAFRPLQGKASLDFMIEPLEPMYLEQLKQFAKDIPNVNFIPTVPMPDIVSFISQYDLGVYLLTAESFNHKHAWPNKIFEFIQARLGIIVSPLPDMLSLVKATKVGMVTKDFSHESLTQTIMSLTPQEVDSFKQNAHAASQDLCWEKNNELIHKTIENLLEA